VLNQEEQQENTIIGHQKNRQLLLGLHRSDCAAGSYLFSGMESIGKKLTAFWFAKLVNCKSKPAPCNRCISCRKIDQGVHPDVKFVEKLEDKTVITIDQVREQIIEEANYKPFEGRFRVFIVDDAHLLNEQAQNAMLKTLEEPSPTTIIILITSRVSELIPTVVSRCREIKFFSLSSGEVQSILEKKLTLPPEKVKLLTSLASGAPGKAIFLAQDDDFWKRREEIFQLLEKLPDGKLGDVLDFCSSYRVSRQDVGKLESTFEIILSWFRDLSFMNNGMSGDSLINPDFEDSLKHVIYCYDAADILSIQDLTLEIRKLIFNNNLNIKMGLQRLMIKIMQAGTVKIR